LPALAAIDVTASQLPDLLAALLAGQVARGRRALRGRTDTAEHPRVFIWGVVEARLQSVDLAILAGLVDGVWPPAADPGPWLSRPMRAKITLPPPEADIGQAAHDFASLICASGQAVLSCPARYDGAPSVPSRFLLRLETLLAASGLVLQPHPAAAWAARLDQPVAIQAERPPSPRPPLSFRPRKLSITEIEIWRADPYAIYAKHILKLKPLQKLDREIGDAEFGQIVHAGLHEFYQNHGTAWPKDAVSDLFAAFELALHKIAPPVGIAEWWRPRLRRIAQWVDARETERRQASQPRQIATEVAGTWVLSQPGGNFTLVGRADRIDVGNDDGLAIIDYKTGTVPNQKQVEAGHFPQLPLEAAMAEMGGFAGLTGKVRELSYWSLKGDHEIGQQRSLFKNDPEAIQQGVGRAVQGLQALIDRYDQAETPYLATPNPANALRYPDYDQLARRAEWAANAEDPNPDDGDDDDPT
jgi:ATP-dependent helicase/nuclease subunit B